MANRSELLIHKHVNNNYNQDISYSKVIQIYFFILYGFSYFSDKIFFNKYMNSDKIIENEKGEEYIYLSSKISIILSFALIIIVLAKQYTRTFISNLFGVDLNINLFLMTCILIISKLITLFLIYVSHNDYSIFVIYSFCILVIIMLLGLSLFLSLIQDTIILVFSKNLSTLKNKMKFKDSYLDSLSNPIKLILSFLIKRTKERSF